MNKLEVVDRSDIDRHLLSAAYVKGPYALYDMLRRDFPVYWSMRWSAWLVTRYDLALSVLRDPQRFSNSGRYQVYLSQLPPAERAQLGYLTEHYENGGLVQSDPPEHTRLRRLVNSAFTPRVVATMRQLVEEVVDALLDKVPHHGQVELIRAFAFPLPAIVIAGMLGVPPEERDDFKELSASVQRFLGSGDANLAYALEAQDSWRQLNGYFGALLAERKRQPQGDVVSTLAAAQDADESLGDDEIIRTCGAMLIAGHETTTNLIASGVLALLQHPSELEALHDGRTPYAAAVEEVLRYDSPFQSVPRTVTADTMLGGEQLGAGQLVHVMLGAANRDPAQFKSPARFDIGRTDNKQLAFGYGVHHCLGAALARLEAPVALQRLFEHYPRLGLADEEPVWKRSMVQRGLERLVLNVDGGT